MDEIDALLMAIENRTRREILKKLAEGKQYALRMAKELQLSQQAIMKQLETLERISVVQCTGQERSDRGPPRKLYTMARNFSLFIDVGPGLFDIREYDLEDVELAPDLQKYLKNNDLGEVLEIIEREIRDVERRRVQLLKAKERILSKLINYE